MTRSNTGPRFNSRSHRPARTKFSPSTRPRISSSAKFEVRQKALRELEIQGEDAEEALTRAQEQKLPLEHIRRVEQVLAKVKGPSPEKRQTLRSLEALEAIGTAQARQAFAGLAKGAPGHWLTDRAQQALAQWKRVPRNKLTAAKAALLTTPHAAANPHYAIPTISSLPQSAPRPAPGVAWMR